MFGPDDTTDFHDDDNEDLSQADRGDTVDAGGEDGEKQPRDEKGKFKSKDSGKEAESEEEESEEEESEEESGEEESEEEESEEEESEEEESEEEESDDAKDDKNLAIRLNKMREQRDRERAAREALERQIAEASGGKSKEEKTEVDPIADLNAELDTLYEKVEEARADGDTKTAAQLQRKIDATNREIVKIEAEQIASKTTSQATEDAKYDALLDVIENEIDLINPKHDDFDPKAVKALEFHVEAYEKMGLKPSQALSNAAKLLFGYGSKKAAKQADDNVVVPLKKKVDVKKAIDNKKKQPPDMADKGVNKGDDTEIDVEKLDDEEMDKLPASKLRQMRGDFG